VDEGPLSIELVEGFVQSSEHLSHACVVDKVTKALWSLLDASLRSNLLRLVSEAKHLRIWTEAYVIDLKSVPKGLEFRALPRSTLAKENLPLELVRSNFSSELKAACYVLAVQSYIQQQVFFLICSGDKGGQVGFLLKP